MCDLLLIFFRCSSDEQVPPRDRVITDCYLCNISPRNQRVRSGVTQHIPNCIESCIVISNPNLILSKPKFILSNSNNYHFINHLGLTKIYSPKHVQRCRNEKVTLPLISTIIISCRYSCIIIRGLRRKCITLDTRATTSGQIHVHVCTRAKVRATTDIQCGSIGRVIICFRTHTLPIHNNLIRPTTLLQEPAGGTRARHSHIRRHERGP